MEQIRRVLVVIVAALGLMMASAPSASADPVNMPKVKEMHRAATKQKCREYQYIWPEGIKAYMCRDIKLDVCTRGFHRSVGVCGGSFVLLVTKIGRGMGFEPQVCFSAGAYQTNRGKTRRLKFAVRCENLGQIG